MNQILYSERRTGNSNKKIVLVLIVLLIILILSVCIISNMLKDKILANVYVGDVNIGMQTKETAKEMLYEKFKELENASVNLVLNGENKVYKAKELGFDGEGTLNATLEKAYEYGRNGNFFGNSANLVKSYFNDILIRLNLEFNEEKLKVELDKLIDDNKNAVSDDKYEVSGDKLYIHKGNDGKKVDFELAKSYIAAALLNNVDTVYIPIRDGYSKRIDFEKLYDEIYVAPKDASCVFGDNFEVVVDVPGVYMDLESAKESYNNALDGTDFVIELKKIDANIKVADLEKDLFNNVLATFSNTYDETVTGRVQNLKVAAERCNNTILYPGDEFSYNKALGTRTVANGFAPGHSFAGGKVVTTIGGGICQVSSALYNAVLMADLEVTNRVAHGMYVEYVKPSLDATVVDGAIDFKFKNNRKYPVKIDAKAENGVVTVTLYGIKDKNEPIIEIESVILETIPYKTVKENDQTMKKGTTKVVQEPVNGYVSEAYRIEKDAMRKYCFKNTNF